MPTVTLYADASKGGKKQWSITKHGAVITVEWGLVGGKLQKSTDITKSKGREGTAGYRTPEQNAQEVYERQIRKKREEGYREGSESSATETRATTDIFTGLDKTFVPAKPLNKMDVDKLRSLDEEGKLWVQRKRDGRRTLALITRTGNVKLYSRRLDELTGHVPRVENVLDGESLPLCTILDGEIIIDNDGKDNFRETGRFLNPATEPTKAAQIAAGYNVRYYLFDVLFFDGQPVWQMPYEARYKILTEMFPGGGHDGETDNPVYVAPLLSHSTFEENMQHAETCGWEGLICWLKDEGSTVRIGGKPKRCNAAKWKPKENDDFIATGLFKGSGELSNTTGGLYIEQIDPNTGERRDCGKVGTGFNDAMRAEILTWDFPCVVEVEYDYQEPTGKLRFPVFKRKRDDKSIDECIGAELETDE